MSEALTLKLPTYHTPLIFGKKTLTAQRKPNVTPGGQRGHSSLSDVKQCQNDEYRSSLTGLSAKSSHRTLGHPLRNPPEEKTRVMETAWERNTNMPYRLQGNFTHYAIIY